MGLKILHNPRCSKSRQTLAILSDNGIDVDIIEYLKDVPSEKTLRQIINILGIKPRDLLRTDSKVSQCQTRCSERRASAPAFTLALVSGDMLPN